MISLHASQIPVENPEGNARRITRITTNARLPKSLQPSHMYVGPLAALPSSSQFAAHAAFGDSVAEPQPYRNLFRLPTTLSHLSEGDIVKADPTSRALRVLYRRKSSHNAFLLTERCNSFCLMCSQPPRDVDDGYIVDDVMEALPLIDPETTTIGLTGGEPTLLGERFIRLVHAIKAYLPRTALHILSNGRNFKSAALANAIGAIKHPDIMFGIPLYSDLSDVHDFVVQADGAFDETVRGIINLRAARVPIEIRVVIHKQTYSRLPALAEFISRNLTFVDHVALMGLEMTGFTKANLEALWIDPFDYQNELISAVEILDRFRIHTSIYNHQLCLVPESIRKFAVKSISDWKNEYMSECNGCTKRHDCGGFFSSATLRYSSNIAPFS